MYVINRTVPVDLMLHDQMFSNYKEKHATDLFCFAILFYRLDCLSLSFLLIHFVFCSFTMNFNQK